MNGGARRADQMLIGPSMAVLKYRNLETLKVESEMSGMTAFMVAVGGTSLVCYLLMSRAQARKARRDSGGDSSSSDISSGDGWSLFSSSGSDSSSSHDSGSSSDSGGDSGGGGGGGGD